MKSMIKDAPSLEDVEADEDVRFITSPSSPAAPAAPAALAAAACIM